MPLTDPNAKHEDVVYVLEYWVVDYAGFGGIRFIGKPKQPTITVYTLAEDQEYVYQQFRGENRIVSKVLRDLSLTAEEVFMMGR